MTTVNPVGNGLQGVTGSGNFVGATSPTLVTPASLGVQQAALNMNSNSITNLATPVTATDAATKAYADSIAAGLNPLPGCAAATTANLTATYSNGTAGIGATLTNSGAQAAFAVDGYSASLNDRILVKNQATSAQNGVYTVTTVGDGSTNWVLTRATDYDTPTQIQPGDLFSIENGTVNALSSWYQTDTVVTVGISAIAFSVFFNPAAYATSGANSNITSLSGLTGAIAAPTAIQDSSANNLLAFNYIPSAINYLSIFNTTTGQSPIIAATGSDTNVGLILETKSAAPFMLKSTLSSGAVQFMTGTANQHTTNLTFANTANTRTVTFPDADGTATLLGNASTGSGSVVLATSPTITTPVIGQINDGNGNAMLGFSASASSVNYNYMANSATGIATTFGVAGTDPNISCSFLLKGTGSLVIYSTGNTPLQFSSGTASQHITNFSFANTANTRTVTFPDADGTATLLGNSSTGSGNVVLQTSPSLTSPTLGVANATSINFGGSALGTYVYQSTWSPTFTFGTAGDLAVVYSSQIGFYTQIGGVVYYYFLMAFTPTYTTSSGAAVIGGFPVTSSAACQSIGTIAISSAVFVGYNVLEGVASSNTMNILTSNNSAGYGFLSTSAFPSGTAYALTGSGFYFT